MSRIDVFSPAHRVSGGFGSLDFQRLCFSARGGACCSVSNMPAYAQSVSRLTTPS
jgi:hypothetical protein